MFLMHLRRGSFVARTAKLLNDDAVVKTVS